MREEEVILNQYYSSIIETKNVPSVGIKGFKITTEAIENHKLQLQTTSKLKD